MLADAVLWASSLLAEYVGRGVKIWGSAVLPGML